MQYVCWWFSPPQWTLAYHAQKRFSVTSVNIRSVNLIWEVEQKTGRWWFV